jgi:hypothetical protein
VIDREQFEKCVDRILTETDLLMEKEHESVYEFFEDEFPVFKLVYSDASETPPEEAPECMILIAFHMEVDPSIAIPWYLKIRDLVDKLYLTGSYIKDDSGATYMGQDAHIVYRQKIEREVINSIKVEAAKRKAKLTPKIKATNLNASDDAEAALAAFDEWDPKRNGKNN